mmetsp:Transcript_71559/g.198629  ORF Transcript_71559/g.198629 Transcript_71559/m.198629 type:complete len:101 (+) Transcript_71559:153-455(+)
MSKDAEAGQEQPEEKNSCKECCFTVLDCIATIVRTIVAIGKGIFWTCQRCCYPFKEMFFQCWDSFQAWYSPYKNKKPITSCALFTVGRDTKTTKVPNFQY